MAFTDNRTGSSAFALRKLSQTQSFLESVNNPSKKRKKSAGNRPELKIVAHEIDWLNHYQIESKFSIFEHGSMGYSANITDTCASQALPKHALCVTLENTSHSTLLSETI